jgi:hypothetical protein
MPPLHTRIRKTTPGLQMAASVIKSKEKRGWLESVQTIAPAAGP